MINHGAEFEGAKNRKNDSTTIKIAKSMRGAAVLCIKWVEKNR